MSLLDVLLLAPALTAPSSSPVAPPAMPSAIPAGQEARARVAPVAGALGAGDPYYPDAGSGGIDVQGYDLRLEVDMERDHLDATATVTLVAEHALASFSLDLVGLEVATVTVDGQAAAFEHAGRDLVITPARPIDAGATATASIEYSGSPALAPDESVTVMGIPGVGWWRKDTGVYTISECVGAASWFPCNDHPIDKATVRIRVTVAEPWVAAANGLVVEETTEERADGSVWRTTQFEARDPMATYLATVNIARFEVRREEGPRGMPLTLYYPEGAAEEELAAFARTAEMIVHFETLFGPYPFECYGGVLAYEPIGGALETQTLPVYSRGTREGTVAHELAHQWFGNAVSLARWEDLWLNEGFASYAEWLWREHVDGPEALERTASRTLRFLSRRSVASPHDPGVLELWSGRTYQRGAYVLHALRGELGDERFFTLCKEWVARNLHGNATTADFIALAEEVGERDLEAFFATWLFGDVVPADR